MFRRTERDYFRDPPGKPRVFLVFSDDYPIADRERAVEGVGVFVQM
jgi:hypothetical protein